MDVRFQGEGDIDNIRSMIIARLVLLDNLDLGILTRGQIRVIAEEVMKMLIDYSTEDMISKILK